ncbi:MAG: hypothetical protein C4330_09595 [Chitinophagaceae bacterium]
MYDQAGNNFLVAVPVLETAEPQEVVDKAYQLHGITLYDIHAMRRSNGQKFYTVRYLDNGVVQSEKINADGTDYMDMNMINDQMNSTSSNAAMDMSDTTKRPMNGSNSSNMNTGSGSMSNGLTTTSGTDMGNGKTKVKTKNANGQGSKTKYKNGEMIKNKQCKGNTNTNGTNGRNGTNATNGTRTGTGTSDSGTNKGGEF